MTVAGVSAALVAHEGGWDEALLVAGPILAMIGILMLAKERVEAAATGVDPTDSSPNADQLPATDQRRAADRHAPDDHTATS